MITSGSEKLIAVQNAEIGEDGGEIDIPVTEEWGAGAYVTATLFRPGDAQESRMPMRAIGIKWLAVDPAERKLAVTLGAPQRHCRASRLKSRSAWPVRAWVKRPMPSLPRSMSAY